MIEIKSSFLSNNWLLSRHSVQKVWRQPRSLLFRLNFRIIKNLKQDRKWIGNVVDEFFGMANRVEQFLDVLTIDEASRFRSPQTLRTLSSGSCSSVCTSFVISAKYASICSLRTSSCLWWSASLIWPASDWISSFCLCKKRLFFQSRFDHTRISSHRSCPTSFAPAAESIALDVVEGVFHEGAIFQLTFYFINWVHRLQEGLFSQSFSSCSFSCFSSSLSPSRTLNL